MSATQRRPVYNFFGTPLPSKVRNAPTSANAANMHPESPLSRPQDDINSSAKKFGSLFGVQHEEASATGDCPLETDGPTKTTGLVAEDVSGVNRQLLLLNRQLPHHNESISSMECHHTVVPITTTSAIDALSTLATTTTNKASFLRDVPPIVTVPIDERNSSISVGGAPLFNPLGGGGVLTSNTQSMNSPVLVNLKTNSSSLTFNSNVFPVTTTTTTTSTAARSDIVFSPPEERRMTVAPNIALQIVPPQRRRHFVDPTAQEELCDGINDFHCDAYYNGLLRYQRRDDAEDKEDPEIIKTRAIYEKCMNAAMGDDESSSGEDDDITTPKSQNDDGDEDVEDILCSLVEKSTSPSKSSHIIADSGIVFERQFSKTGSTVIGISQPMGGTDRMMKSVDDDDDDDTMITLNALMAMTADSPDLSYLHRFQNSVSMALTTDALKLTQNAGINMTDVASGGGGGGIKPRYLLGTSDGEEEEEELEDRSTSASSCLSSPDYKNNEIASPDRLPTSYLGDPRMVLTSMRRPSLTSTSSTATGHKSPTWATTTSNRIPALTGSDIGSSEQQDSAWGEVVGMEPGGSNNNMKPRALVPVVVDATSHFNIDGTPILSLYPRRNSGTSSIATTLGPTSPGGGVDPPSPAADGATPSPRTIQRISSWYSTTSTGGASISSGDVNTSSHLPTMSSPGTIKDGSGAGGVHFSSSSPSVHLQQQQQTDNAAVVVSTLPKAAIPITPSPTTSRKSTPASGLDIAAPHQHHNGLESQHAMATYPPHPPTAISITMEHIPSPEPATYNRLPMGRSTPPSILVGGKHSTATSPTPNASIISGDHNNNHAKAAFVEMPTASSSTTSTSVSSDENGFDEDPLTYWGLAGITRKGSSYRQPISRAPSVVNGSSITRSVTSSSAVSRPISIVDSITNHSSLSSPPVLTQQQQPAAPSTITNHNNSHNTGRGEKSPPRAQQADTPKKKRPSSDNNSRYSGSGSLGRRTPSASNTPRSSLSTSHGNTISASNQNSTSSRKNNNTVTSGDFGAFLKARGAAQDLSSSLPAYSDELDTTGSDSSDDDGIIHDVVLGGSFNSEVSSPHINNHSNSNSVGGGSVGNSSTATTNNQSSTARGSGSGGRGSGGTGSGRGAVGESAIIQASHENLLRSYSPELQPLGQQLLNTTNKKSAAHKLRSNSPSDYDEPFRPFTSSSTTSSSTNKRATTTSPRKLDDNKGGATETSVSHLPEELRASALNNITRNLNSTGASTPISSATISSSNTNQQQTRERSKSGITSPLPDSGGGGGAFLFGDVIVDMNNEIFVSKKATKSLRESMALSGSLRRCTVQRCAGQRASIRALAFLTHDESIFAVSAAEPYSLVKKQYGSICASRKGLETHGAPCRPVLSGAYSVTPKAALPTYPRPYLGAASGATTYQELPRSQLYQTSTTFVISSSPHGRTDPKNSVVSEGFATAFNGFFAVDMAALMAMVRLIMGTSAETYLLAHCIKKQQAQESTNSEGRSVSPADGGGTGLGTVTLGIPGLHVGPRSQSPALQDGGVAPESTEMKLAHIILWLRSQVARVMHFYSASQFQSRISGSATPLGSTGVSFPLSYRSLVSDYEVPPLINFRTANGMKELIRSSTHRSTASMTDIHRRHMLRQLVPYGQNLGSDPLEESVIVGIMAGHSAAVNHITVSSDMRFVATSSGDGMLIVYDAVTYKRIAGCSHPAEVRCSSFSKNGKYIVTGCADSGCRLWPTKKNHTTPVSSYFGHSAPITTISFQVVSGDFVVSGSEDGAVHLWNAASGKPVRDFRNHRKPVIYTAFAHIPIASLTKQNGMEIVEVPAATSKKTTSSSGKNSKAESSSAPVDLNRHFIITVDAVSVVLMEVTTSAMQGSNNNGGGGGGGGSGGESNGGCPVLGIADVTAFFHGEVVSNRRVANHSRSNVPGAVSDHSGSPFSSSSLNQPSSNNNTTSSSAGGNVHNNNNNMDSTILPIIPVHQRRSHQNRDGLDRTQMYARGGNIGGGKSSKNQPPPTVETPPTSHKQTSSNTTRNARASALRAALAVDVAAPLHGGGGSTQLPTITSVQLAPQKTFPLCFFIARSDRVVSLFQFQLVESKDTTTLQPRPPSSTPTTGSANPRRIGGVGGAPTSSSAPAIKVQARLSQEVWSTCSSGEVTTMAAGPFNSILCGDTQGNVFKIRLEQFERQRLEVEERQKKMTRMMPSAGERID